MRYEVVTRGKSSIKIPKIISLDTEYTDLNIRKANLLSVSIGVSPDLTYISECNPFTRACIENADIIFTWNGVVDWYMLTKSGFNVPKEKIFDAMLMEHLIDERLDHGLGDFALREYNDNYKKEFWDKYQTYQEAPKEVAYEYEMRDGCYTYRAGVRYLEELKSKLDLVRHVHRLQWALFDTEIKGLRVNRELMELTKHEMSEKINSCLPQLRKDYYEYCQLWELQNWGLELNKRKSHKGKSGVRRPTFSFTSDKQVSWLVYDAMECPVISKTKKGNPSCDMETLEKLSQDYPGLTTLVDYKKIKSVYATFVLGMLERVEDGRIYPRFNVNGTTTGRISHSNPNMGNLPTDGVIRNFFLPDPDRVLVGADYSQLEVVVEANLTEDKQLLKIILEGASKHDITAQGLSIPRNDAKTLNFALQYGATARKICKILNISVQEAENVYNRYWELYSGVKALKNKVEKEMQETGQVTNLFGRVRHFSRPKNEYEEARFYRQGYNFIVQGTGADMTNRATYRIKEAFESKQLGNLLFSVHDEILTQAKTELSSEAIDVIVSEMEESNTYLNLKYPVQAKPYGPLQFWSKT